ncbi:MAG: PLD nuclease N-terminal domain-containing protein [Planctomycetota bacterium]
MPWYLLSGLYLMIWSALLIHCLLQRQFYPVFGRRWGTKVFWLLTFVFLNPLLTFLYFVFGFLLRPVKAAESQNPIGFASVAAIAFVGVVLVLFEWPLMEHAPEPVVVSSEAGEQQSQEPGESPQRLEAHVAFVKARNALQTFGSTSAEGNDRASVRRIGITCQNPHRLLDRSARELQKALVRLLDVDKVEYYPYETWPEPGGVLPDVFITMDMLEVDEKTFLHSRRLGTLIQWKVGSTLFAGTVRTPHANAPPKVTFNMESRLDHHSTMMGIESPRAVYKLEANGIVGEMEKSISKQFGNLLGKYGELPPGAAMLYGTYCEPPEFSFLKDNAARQIISGSGLFKNNHTVWRFAEQRKTDEALKAYRDELRTLGWDSEVLEKDYLQMQKQNENIYVFHERRHDPAAGTAEHGESSTSLSGVLMIAHYESYFTSTQIQKAMDALLAGPAKVKTLLAFERYFRTPEQIERLRARVEASAVRTLDGCLMLGRYWADQDRTDKGQKWLMRARAMQRAEKESNAKSQEIQSLAEKLGDESLAEIPVSEQILRDAGFVSPSQLTGPLEIEKALDEPVLLYRRLDNGRMRTIALRAVRSRDISSSVPYRLLAVDKREGRSSSSQTVGRIRPDGLWAADFSLQNLAANNESMQSTVESAGDERFLFVIRP